MPCLLFLLQTMTTGEGLNDNKWHSVMLRRRQKRLLLGVDDEQQARSKSYVTPPGLRSPFRVTVATSGYSRYFGLQSLLRVTVATSGYSRYFG